MPKRVMVVEDEVDARELLAEILVDEGYEVTTAGDGRDALAKLRATGPYDAVVLDLVMPVMDGYAFRIEQLKDPVLAKVPVFVVSGEVSRGVTPIAGVAGQLSKPLEIPKLLASLRNLP